MIQKITLLFLLSYTGLQFSQNINLEDYKYIIVPDKFDFLKEKDQYQTSSLTKFLFKKKGFEVFLSDENLPKDLSENKCLALLAVVKNESSMLTVKNSIEMKDCFGKTVYTSKIGKSRSKEYKKGYQEAIREAFETMTDFTYSYKPKQESNVNSSLVKETIIKKDATKIDTKPQVVVKKDVIVEENSSVNTNAAVLYAQPRNSGFQLVNTKPEVVFMILKTSNSSIFIIDGKNGILYKNGENWVAEYYQNNQLIMENYQIKF